jgi:hypothetical protein
MGKKEHKTAPPPASRTCCAAEWPAVDVLSLLLDEQVSCTQ